MLAEHVELIAHVHYDAVRDALTTPTMNVEEIPASLTPVFGKIHKRVTKTLLIFPDSGAGICLASPGHILQLNLSLNNLIPCRKRIKAVGGSTIPCRGWISITYTIGAHTTTQPTYICDKVDRIYFSKAGCKETNILSPMFPFPMDHKFDQRGRPPTTQHPPQIASITDTVGGQSDDPLPSNLNRKIEHSTPARPTTMPYAPTEENVGKLEAYLLKSFSDSAFNDSGELPVMDAPPGKIHLKEDAIPQARHNPIPTPHHWKSPVKKLIDRNVERGIYKRADVGVPSEWCATAVVVPKDDGSPRLTVDYQHLNSQTLRETHYTPPPFQVASQIPPNTYKTVIDVVDGYHSIALEEGSQRLTAFITEWGRYIHLRAPQGWKGSGDLFTRRYDDLTQDFPNKVKIVDDALLYQQSIKDSFFQCWDYLTLLAEHGVVANKKKFKFARKSVEFAGLMVTSSGIEPSPKILSAIENFPTPTNITNARSWFGLVNQVSWAYAVSPLMQPFRDLIKPNKTFYWDDQLENLFQDSKSQLVAAVKDGVQSFDIKKPTCLQTDWSKDGIGYLLLQQHCSCKSTKAPLCCPDGWKLVYAGSRVTQPSESRYSPTEGEALAVSWALHHSRLFTLGCNNLLVSVDHKPLLGIFKNRSLDSIDNPRILNLKESTLRWDFTISHNPGKWHKGPDALSRNPDVAHIEASRDIGFYNPICEYTTMSDLESASARDEYVRAITVSALLDLTSCAVSHDDIRKASSQDPDYNQLVQQIQRGFPSSKHATPPNIREFWEVRQRLSTIDGVALLDKRTVIPASLRKQMLEFLHSAHQGIVGMKARANQSIYWPGMDASIKQYKGTCAYCQTNAPSQPREPIILSPSPEFPFQQICLDYFEINQHSYLVTVDRFSGWPSIYHFPTPATSSLLIKTCRDLFAAYTYGVPEELGSDGGPQFKAGIFNKFLKD